MPQLEMITKQFIAKVDVDSDERTVTAIISTDAIDRDHEVLKPKGANFEQFEKNPVVLWAHDYSAEPVGKALWIKKGTKRITAKIKFAETEQADNIFKLFKGGFLNAFSVGFIPTKSHSPTPDEIKKKPELAEAVRIFDEWELLEFSVVPVPANPEALAIAVKTKGIELCDDIKSAMPELPEIEEPEPENNLPEADNNLPELEIKEESPIIVNRPKILVPVIKLRRAVPVVKRHDPNIISMRAIRKMKGLIV